MTTHSWFRSLFGRSSSGRRRPSRLAVEALEGRYVPSTLTVWSSADDGSQNGTLRHAVARAHNGDVILLSAAIKNPILLAGGELLLNQNVTIESVPARTPTINGGAGSRLFEIAAGTNVTLDNLNLINGNGLANNPGGTAGYDSVGGAILNFGTLTIAVAVVALEIQLDDQGLGPPLVEHPRGLQGSHLGLQLGRLLRYRLDGNRHAGLGRAHAAMSGAAKDIVKGGRGLVASHVAGHDGQNALPTVNPAALAQHAAVRLVAVHRAILHGHQTIERVDAPAQGRGSIHLVSVDGAADEQQDAVLTVDPAAKGGPRGVNPVGVYD